MSVQAVIFIICLAVVAYAYLGYPILIFVAARLAGRPISPRVQVPRTFSVVIAAYNEAATIRRRILELLAMLDRADPGSEIIVVSDGSTDQTAEIAAQVADPRLRVVRQPSNMGKAMALNAGVAAASNPIVVFADARQQWAPDAIDRLLEPFADPAVGAVGGDLLFRNDDGSLAGVGLYWKLEAWIRRNESRLYCAVQVPGAICAVRRELYRPLERGTILDDVSWPLDVAMMGYRVIQEPRACAFDRLPERAGDEIRRKVRTLSGNFQLLFRKPGIIVPWTNPIWFCVISHKLLRLVVPWAMIGALIAAAAAPEAAIRWLFLAQLAGYLAGAAGVFFPALARGRLMKALASLLVLNAAALVSWFVYFSGRSERSWKKVAYQPQAGPLPVIP